MPAATPPPGRWAALPHVWSVLLPLVVLAPTLLPGYVLSYDMVWVPDLAVRRDFLGAGEALPRAVPSDLVVALLDDVVPGMVLQKIVLLGALVLLAQGALRLVGRGVGTRAVAVSVAVWSPFVAERLWMGHWPVLLGYAVLPWLVLQARRVRAGQEVPVGLLVLVPLGSLSASAGIVTALALTVLVVSRRVSRRRLAGIAGLVVAANAPWVVTGALHGGGALTQASTAVFGLHGEGAVPAPLAALTLGGIWNAEVVPASRSGALGWVALTTLLALVLLGAGTWWRRDRDEAGRLATLWATGYGLAVLTWLAPGLVDHIARLVPGGGVLRDGARYLGLCLPLLVATTAAGAGRLLHRVDRLAAPPVAVTLALVPLMVLPELAWGIGGALRAVDYPASWSAGRAALVRAVDRGEVSGDLLVLPFSSYRAPAWNGDRKVLDPLGRFLPSDYVVDDQLFVSGRRLAGDDPRVPVVRRLLADPPTEGTLASLRRLGVGAVAEDLDASGPRVRLPGARTVFADDSLRIVALPGTVAVRGHSPGWWAAVGTAWTLFAGAVSSPLVVAARRRLRRRGRGPRSC